MKPAEPSDPLEELVSKLRQQLRALDTESHEDSFLHGLIDLPGLILTTEAMLKDAEKRLAGSRQHSPRPSNVPFLVPFHNIGCPPDLVEKHHHPQPSPAFSSQVTAYIGLGVFGLGLGGYALHEGRLTHKLMAENQLVAASLNAARNQIDRLTATAPEQPSPPELRSIPAAAPGHGTQGRQRESLRSRFGGQDTATADMQEEVVVRHFDRTGQRREKPVLASSIAPLIEPVATMDTQLVSSQKRGERNHYEFDIDKSKAFQPGGPLGIRLRKANVKHQYADLELLIGGRSLSQNHVNLYQPVVFYTPSTAQPVELVISSIDSGRIRGYVSIPKSRQPELASMSNANTETAASTK